MLLILGSMIPMTVWASPGEDVHSGAMNVEADGESAQTKKSKETKVVDVEVSEEDVQAEIKKDKAKAKADEELANESVEPEDEKAEESLVKSGAPLRIVLSVGIIILVIVAGVVTFIRSRRKHYRGRR